MVGCCSVAQLDRAPVVFGCGAAGSGGEVAGSSPAAAPDRSPELDADLAETDAWHAAAILVLGAIYWLIRERDHVDKAAD